MDWRGFLLLLAARTSFKLRRFGTGFFVGDAGSSPSSGGGLKICDVSMEVSVTSLILDFLVAAEPRLSTVASLTVFRRSDVRELFGAGVNSSSSSSSSSCRLVMLWSMSDSSSSSTTTFF
jgi:hypothetical protein